MANYENLFQAHGGANEQVAKSALEKVITKYITKHVRCQVRITELLLSASSPSLLKNIKKLSLKMARYNDIIGELCSSWETLFSTKFDTHSVVIEACEKWYPLAVGREHTNTYTTRSQFVAKVNNPDDVDIERIIRESLEGKLPGNISVKVVNTQQVVDEATSVFGLYPQDYPSFTDFFIAVKQELIRREENGTLGEISEELRTMIEKGKDIVDRMSTTPITDRAIEKAIARAKKGGTNT